MQKETFFCQKRTLNFRGKIKDLSSPLVMGIMNITPDSFYDGGSYRRPWDAVKMAGAHLEGGADILDMGAASSRPGASLVDPDEERQRLLPALKAVVKHFPEAIISVDTYHGSTARRSVEEGASMINDISAGSIDPLMFRTVAELQVPYVLMHMKGRPDGMQNNPVYGDVVKEVAAFFAEKLHQLNELGMHDIIIDPGFGFGKSLEDNYKLLAGLAYFALFDLPLLVGFSRKSMVNKILKTTPAEALNGTTVLNTLALDKGAGILRVHDAREASEAIRIHRYLSNQQASH